jgi:DNA-binding MltR family transcriptional regulator
MPKKKVTEHEIREKLKDWASLFTELEQTNDRAMAILCGAFLDEILALLLQGFLVEGSPATNGLFDADRPLGTYSAKIQLAHALGLITDDEYNDLDTIRKVRNRFAHALQGLSFTDDSITDLCKNLKMSKLRKKHISDSMTSRQHFDFAFKMLMIELTQRERHIEDVRRVSLSNEHTLIGDKSLFRLTDAMDMMLSSRHPSNEATSSEN